MKKRKAFGQNRDWIFKYFQINLRAHILTYNPTCIVQIWTKSAQFNLSIDVIELHNEQINLDMYCHSIDNYEDSCGPLWPV